MVFISELPVDVLSKIVSYCIGQPEYIKLNHNKTLSKIQNKQKMKHYNVKPFYAKELNTMTKTNHFFIVHPLHLDDILKQERKNGNHSNARKKCQFLCNNLYRIF